jgi:hypothetical protein
MKHYTTADLAEKFDVSKSTITRTAGRLGIGTRLYGRILFTTKDVKEMEDGIMEVPPKLADRIRAADSLGKCFGLFTEKTDGKLVVTIRRGGDSAASLQKRGTE